MPIVIYSKDFILIGKVRKMCQIDKMHIHRRCKTPENPCIVYIVWKGEQLGICSKCWEKFPLDLEWGDSPKLTIKELLSDESRFGNNPIETEYKPKNKGKNDEKEPSEDDECY